MSVVPVRESEAGFTTAVIELAQLCGFLVIHFRPAQTHRGYRTALQGDKGYPDITAAGWGRWIVAELKVGTNKLDVRQQEWVVRAQASPVESYVWYPCDWPAIEACFLRRGGPRCVP